MIKTRWRSSDRYVEHFYRRQRWIVFCAHRFADAVWREAESRRQHFIGVFLSPPHDSWRHNLATRPAFGAAFSAGLSFVFGSDGLQFLAGLKSHSLAGRNANLFAG